MPNKKSDFDFEKTLAELENLVEKMESSDVKLEDSLKYFERGITLTRACQKALAEAEQKVQILIQENGEQHLDTFKTEEE